MDTNKIISDKKSLCFSLCECNNSQLEWITFQNLKTFFQKHMTNITVKIEENLSYYGLLEKKRK